MKLVEKELARKLRRQGKSINEIVTEGNLVKASVSVWVRDIILTEKQKHRLTEKGRNLDSVEKRREARLFNEQARRQVIFNKAKEDYKSVSLEDLKLIGIMLYLGEGSKTSRGMVSFSNSDPNVIKIIARFFREVCEVPENKFRGNVHTFAHANIKKTEQYWSKITGIPRSQFYKTYVKPSAASLQKRQTLPYGTFGISVNDTKLFLTIMGWIERIKELTVGSSGVRAL